MMFYDGHTLQSTDARNSFFNKKQLELSDEYRQLLSKQNSKFTDFLKEMDLKVTVNYFADNSRAIICLDGTTPENKSSFAKVTISTVEHNCSAILVSDLYSAYYYSLGLGWFLLDLIEQWAIYAGYTLLLGNTAGSEQNLLIPTFKEKGWIESDIQYINARTNNKNIWLYKVIANAEEAEPTDEEFMRGIHE